MGRLRARRAPRPDPGHRLDALLARPRVALDPRALDEAGWDRLLEHAWHHGLLAPLLDRLPAGDGALPAPARERLRRLVLARRLAAAPLREAQREVLGALAAAGLRAVALKGIGLADRLYAHPDLRPAGDVDVLVPAADLDPAAAALEPLGWRLDPGPHPDYQRRHHRHVTLLRDGAPAVELHHRAYTGFGMVLDGEPLLARARPGASGALVLAPEDELLQLALHAAGHLLERLAWLEDLLSLLDRTPALDWETALARARAAGGASAAAFAFARLATLGAPIPAAATSPLGAARAAAAERLRRRALATPWVKVNQTCAIAFHALLADGPGRAAGTIGHQAEWLVRRLTRAHIHASRVYGRSLDR